MKDPSCLLRGIEFTMATPADLQAVQSCLQSNDLPHQDVAPHIQDFCLAWDAGRLVGTVGLERPGRNGLLRSLSVLPNYRSRGLGSVLCDRIEAHARRVGVTRLYLLTTTAQAFFERRGYALESRDNAPEEIRQTGEFRWCCPASAVFMSRLLPAG